MFPLKKTLAGALLFIVAIPLSSVQALTVLEAVNSLQATDPNLPTGVTNPKGSIGYILANIFWGGTGKIQAQYLDTSGITGASQWTTSGSSVYYNGGNVGIGVETPTSALEILTNGWTTGQMRLRTSQDVALWGLVFLRLNDTNGSAGYFGFGGSNNRMDIWNYKPGATVFGVGGVEQMRITSSGNVGIGTTDPQGKLDVRGNSYLSSTSIGRSGGHYQEIGYNVGFTTTNDTYTYRYTDTSASMRMGFDGFEFRTAPVGTQGSGLILSEKMRITAGGNVGIGISSPGTYRLNVNASGGGNGGIYANSSAGYVAGTFVAPNNAGNSYGLLVNAGTNNTDYAMKISNASNTGNLLFVRGDGNVGIGTTTPSDLLTLSGASGPIIGLNGPTTNYRGLKMSDASGTEKWFAGANDMGNYVVRQNGATDLMTFSGGNMGMGTSSPTEFMEIYGSSKKLKLTQNPGVPGGPTLWMTAAGGASDANAATLRLHTASIWSRTDGITSIGLWDKSSVWMNFYGGNVGIGTAGTASQKLEVNGTTKTNDLMLSNLASCSGKLYTDASGNVLCGTDNAGLTVNTTGYIPKSNGSAFVDSSIFASGANIGIGTANPGSKFTISSPDSNGAFAQSSAGLNLVGTTYDLRMGVDNTNGNSWIESVMTGVGGASFLLNPKNNGKVGIGTTSPGAKLDIAENQVGGGTPIAIFRGTNTVGGGQREINTYYAGISTDSGSVYTNFGSIGAAKENGTQGNTAGFLTLKTNPHGGSLTEAMRITSTGKVGIGTSAPNKLLHIKSATGTNAEINIQSANKPLWGIYHDETSEELRFWNGSNRVVFGSGGNVGIGTTSPGTSLSINQNTTYNEPTLGVATGGFSLLGTGLYGLYGGVKWNGNTWFQAMRNDSATAYNIILQPVGGNVGIGTTSPGAKLDILGAGNQFRMVNSSGALVERLLIDTNSSGVIMNAYDTNLTPIPFIFNQNTTERLRIDTSGNVGIGTATPTAKLDVRAISYAPNQNGGIQIGTTNGVWIAGFKIKSDAGGVARTAIDATDGTGSGTTNEAISIRTNGWVGIGATLPSQKLDVAGTTKTTDLILSNKLSCSGKLYTDASGNVLCGTDNPGLSANTTGYIPKSSGTAFADSSMYASGANIGIGTIDPGTKLHVQGTGNMFKIENTNGVTANQHAQMQLTAGSANNYIWTNNQNSAGFYGGSSALNLYTGQASPIAFFTNTSERMRIDSAGNVGIGATVPSARLHIAGTGTSQLYAVNSGTNPNNYGMDGESVGAGTGSNYGGYFAARNAANNYAIYVQNGYPAAGANNYQLYLGSDAKSYFWGSVGIGTTTPDGKMHIVGSPVAMPATSGTTQTGIIARLQGGGGSNGVLDIGNAGNGISWIQTTNKLDLSLGYPLLLNPNGGNIGIGTTAPRTNLDVLGSSATRAVSIRRGTQGADAGMGTTYGKPYLAIGGLEYLTNSLQTIGFGYGTGTSNQPAEIGFLTTDTASYTKGDIVFANRNGTTNVAPTEVMRIASTGNVGIGITNPGAKLDVLDSFQISRTATYTGNWNAGVTHAAANNYGSLYLTPSLVTGDFVIRDSASATKLYFDTSSGSLGIGTSTPSEKLEVSGNIKATSYLFTSDRRLKENIQTITGSLSKIRILNGVSFDWKESSEHDIGFIAQEVEKVEPSLVKTASDEKWLKSVKYANITALLVNAVKELSAQVDELFRKYLDQQSELERQAKEIELLKQNMQSLQGSMYFMNALHTK